MLPPNSELCQAFDDTSGRRSGTGDSIVPPSSQHPGGCHVLMADGAVKFITDSIEAGNARAVGIVGNATTPESVYCGEVRSGGQGGARPGSQSPYGLWGALGTRDAEEVIGSEF